MATSRSSATRQQVEYDRDSFFEMAVNCIERKGRVEEEKLEMVDNNTAKRAIELPYRGLTIQDEVGNGLVEGLGMQHQLIEMADEV